MCSRSTQDYLGSQATHQFRKSNSKSIGYAELMGYFHLRYYFGIVQRKCSGSAFAEAGTVVFCSKLGP
jgi:hypothetical protein